MVVPNPLFGVVQLSPSHPLGDAASAVPSIFGAVLLFFLGGAAFSSLLIKNKRMQSQIDKVK